MRATTFKLWDKGTIKKAGAQVTHVFFDVF